jgi:hypothetical protein
MGVMGNGSSQNRVIKPVVIRLFLVRHGETLANRKGLVVGQSHSVRKAQMVVCSID